jgi:hypothetical protein
MPVEEIEKNDTRHVVRDQGLIEEHCGPMSEPQAVGTCLLREIEGFFEDPSELRFSRFVEPAIVRA